MKTTPFQADAPVLSSRTLNRALLARQLLLERQKVPVVKAVERLAGLHGQIPRSPFVALWSRLAGFERSDLLAALRAGKLLRATSLRGTLHLLSAADFAAWRPVLQPILERGVNVLSGRAKGLDVAKLTAFGRRAFKKPRTFESLRHELEVAFPKGDVRAMAYLIRMHVPLTMVPTEATWGYPAAAEFVLAEAAAGPADPSGLVKRYLAAFGPASVADAQTWSGFQNLKQAFESLRPELVSFRSEQGKELFDLPKAPRPDEAEAAPVRFIAELDQLLMGHADRTRVIADARRKRLMSANLVMKPAFLVDGVVAGAWKIEAKKKAVSLVLEPYLKLPKKTLADVEAEGERLLAFVDERQPA